MIEVLVVSRNNEAQDICSYELASSMINRCRPSAPVPISMCTCPAA